MASKRRRIETSLVILILMLRVMTYVVSYKQDQQEARRNGVETEKNRDKSSNPDTYVTRCFL